MNNTKFILCLGDGMADHPIASLQNKTPIEAAHTPHMDALSQEGQIGMVDTVPEGLHPGSDVANMGILGFDPRQFYTGRGPIEAASLGLSLPDDKIVFRCNLVHIDNNHMKDFTADHISTNEANILINDLNQAFEDSEISFVAGVSYRHIMIAPKRLLQLTTTAPHDIIGKNITPYIPKGNEEETLAQIMEKAAKVLTDSSVNKKRQQKNKGWASAIWPWSQGQIPTLPSFKETYGMTGGIITAVDLLKGLGKLAGLETPHIPGATGFLDTDYSAKIAHAFDLLNDHQFVYIHVEAPDEAGHMGNPKLKTQAISDFDAHIMGPVRQYQNQHPNTVILVLPDHPTPCALKTHTREAVPFILHYKGITTNNATCYSETEGKQTGLFFKTPWELTSHFLSSSVPNLSPLTP